MHRWFCKVAIYKMTNKYRVLILLSLAVHPLNKYATSFSDFHCLVMILVEVIASPCCFF